jgi:hypothetical protein
MSDADLGLRLDGDRAAYRPDDTLSGTFLPPRAAGAVDAAELSVLWYTEGKGDEDLGVHHFERFEYEEDGPGAVRRERRFATRLPNNPLSYDGIVVKIVWCVRVRLFLDEGGERTVEIPFRLGDVAPATEAAI